MATKSNKKKKSKVVEPEKKAKTKEKKETPLLTPTQIKHKKVLKYMADNGCSMKAALLACGYSESTANKPNRVTKTESWKQMLDRVMPESKLLDIHEKQLQSWRLQSMLFQKQVPDEDIFELMETVGCVVKKVVEIPTGKLVFYIQPDNQSRNKALEMALKLHKRLTDKVEIRDTTPYAGLTDQELSDRIKKGKQFFNKKSGK